MRHVIRLWLGLRSGCRSADRIDEGDHAVDTARRFAFDQPSVPHFVGLNTGVQCAHLQNRMPAMSDAALKQQRLDHLYCGRLGLVGLAKILGEIRLVADTQRAQLP